MEIKEGSLIAVVGKVNLNEEPNQLSFQGGRWQVFPPLGAAWRDGSDWRGGKCEGRGGLCSTTGRSKQPVMQ